jgi:membrane associated rhomboid family serine protease
MFVHADFVHLLFNMLGLFFFGPRLEVHLGARNFVLLYFIGGLAGALLSFLTPYVGIVGASGAVFGVLMAFALHWPREQIYIWGVFPIQARWLVVILTLLSLFGGFGAGFDSVAHFAHLGGFAGGYLFVRWVEHTTSAASFQRRLEQSPLRDVNLDRWKSIDPSVLHEVNRTEYERIMEKIKTAGVGELTPEEIAAMNRFSVQMRSAE